MVLSDCHRWFIMFIHVSRLCMINYLLKWLRDCIKYRKGKHYAKTHNLAQIVIILIKYDTWNIIIYWSYPLVNHPLRPAVAIAYGVIQNRENV